MLQRSEIAKKLKKAIEEERGITIKDNDEKLDVDSLTIMLAIMYVEDNFGIQLRMDKLDFDAFNSLNTLADLVLAEDPEKDSS